MKEDETGAEVLVTHDHDHSNLHAYIGVSLVLGFVFMLLVDQIGSSHMHSTEGTYDSCGIGTHCFT